MSAREGHLDGVVAATAMGSLVAAAGLLEAQLQATSPTARPALEQLWAQARALAGQIVWGQPPQDSDWTAQGSGEKIFLSDMGENTLSLRGSLSLALGFRDGFLAAHQLPGEAQPLVVIGHGDNSQSYCLSQDGRVLDGPAMEAAAAAAWDKSELQQEGQLQAGAPTTQVVPAHLPGGLDEFLGLLGAMGGLLAVAQPGVACPGCSQHNPPGSGFCAHCGQSLQTPKIGVCSGCGQTLPQDARFCPNCGRPSEPPQCSHCHQPLKAGAHFCSACGHSQDQAGAG